VRQKLKKNKLKKFLEPYRVLNGMTKSHMSLLGKTCHAEPASTWLELKPKPYNGTMTGSKTR